MAEAGTIDGEATEVDEAATNEAATERAQMVPITRAPASLAVTPQVEAAELVKRLDVIRDAAENAMEEGIDFGKIPGTDKPTLLKPGAEKLGVLFQLDIQIIDTKTWGPGDHLTVESNAIVYHAPTGARLGSGEGICSTREKKYGKRRQNLACPECGKEAVLKSKKDGEGFFCWRKKDGCGQNFAADDSRLTGQTVGEIDNPELPDTWNTVTKMARKRARVDAVLAVTGASALFAQDLEDRVEAPAAESAPAAPALELATDDETKAAKRALGVLVDRDLDRAVGLWTEALKLMDGQVPKGLAVLLIRLNDEPVPATAPEPGMTPDTTDLPQTA